MPPVEMYTSDLPRRDLLVGEIETCRSKHCHNQICTYYTLLSYIPNMTHDYCSVRICSRTVLYALRSFGVLVIQVFKMPINLASLGNM
jgi:hypothetical protein